MTDHDLLARADAMSDLPHAPHQLIKELVAVLRARDTELATAQTEVEAFRSLAWDTAAALERIADETGIVTSDQLRQAAVILRDAAPELASVSPPADKEEP